MLGGGLFVGIGGERFKTRVTAERFQVFVLSDYESHVNLEANVDGLPERREGILVASLSRIDTSEIIGGAGSGWIMKPVQTLKARKIFLFQLLRFGKLAKFGK